MLVEKDGCKNVNDLLTQCLKKVKKDWRLCVVNKNNINYYFKNETN